LDRIVTMFVAGEASTLTQEPRPMTAMHLAAPAREAGAATGPSRSMRVLLAEDNLVNQKLAVRLMEKAGHQVVVVDDGEQCVQVFATASTPFDLILMDMQMPNQNGIEATLAIRARERLTGSHVPIIALTANAMRGDHERCRAAGMDDYVTKPIRRELLFAAIERSCPPLASAPALSTHVEHENRS
jgi:CheY-like chemotaxis protein